MTTFFLRQRVEAKYNFKLSIMRAFFEEGPSSAVFYLRIEFLLELLIICQKFCLVAMEKGKYLTPFRTQKSSPSSPMVLHTRVWESRSPPGFLFLTLTISIVRVFFFVLISSSLQVAAHHPNVEYQRSIHISLSPRFIALHPQILALGR